MNEMTIRLPKNYKPRLAAVAKGRGLRAAEFARLVLIEAIENEERSRNRAAMQAMVDQAIAYGEVRDRALESAGLNAIAGEAG
jgi:hypothetical protein